MRSSGASSASRNGIRQRSVVWAAAATIAATLVALALPTVASARPLFGTWSPGEPYGGSIARTAALENATGRRVDIVNWYQNWGGGSWITTVQPQAVLAVTASGRTPLLTWEPRDVNQGPEQPAFALAGIAGGRHDAYIASFARGLRDLGVTVYLRPMHEMNGTWYPWGAGVNANSPAQFVAAWQRMHRIFAAEGAANVRWVWAPNNFDASRAYPLEAFYPGAAYVDVLGASGYNWGSARPQFGGWQWFDQVFRHVYERLKALGPQPIWFAEVGSAPDGGDKAAWVRDMFARAQTMDRLQAIVWFNELKELDWRADADPAVAAAFTPLAPGVAYPPPAPGTAAPTWATILPTSSPNATVSAGSVTTATGSTAQDGGKSGPGAGAGAGDATARVRDALRAAVRNSAILLRIYAQRRVSPDRPVVLRWRAKVEAGIKRWIVYLDDRRVRSVRAARRRTHRLRLRGRAAGTHRWRIEGRDGRGRATVSARHTFRV
ncbi:MAG TPA: glycosyl hydrolase, partial [Solirubrobacteraceae bacterium]|nr:glycosyl hydrolase [Solirubrobacteraceae bacterium]